MTSDGTSWADEVLAQEEVWGRAPSAHNTQPWRVRGGGDRDGHGIEVGWSEERHLRVGDPTRRDLFLGLGAVVESLVITAADLGHRVEVDWADDPVPSTARAAVLRRVDGAPGSRWTGADLLSRRTARSAYRPPWVEAEQVDQLDARADLPTGARLTVVDPRWLRRWLPVADRWSLEGPAAAELADWLRLSPGHPRLDQDGLSAACLELSRVEAAALRLALARPVRPLLARSGAMRLIARSATAHPWGTVVALHGPPDLAPQQVGELGRALLRVWLAAAQQGWSSHPLSALLDCPRTARAWPGLPPVAVFRLGIPTRPAARSARLSRAERQWSSWPSAP